MSAETVRVDLGPRSYDIDIGTGNLAELGRFVLARDQVTHAVVVADKNVAATHAVTAVESLHAAGIRDDLMTVEPGEGSKSIVTVTGFFSFAASSSFLTTGFSSAFSSSVSFASGDSTPRWRTAR